MVANSNTVHNCFLMQFNLKMDAVMFPDLYPDWDHVTFGVCVNIKFSEKGCGLPQNFNGSTTRR